MKRVQRLAIAALPLPLTVVPRAEEATNARAALMMLRMEGYTCGVGQSGASGRSCLLSKLATGRDRLPLSNSVLDLFVRPRLIRRLKPGMVPTPK